MYKNNMSLKLITKCTVVGNDIYEFVEKMNSVGFYTYIDEYYDGEEIYEEDEVEIMVFKLINR